MISMNCGIGFNFVFNKTNFEWHELQHSVGDWAEKCTLHCIPKTFNNKCTFETIVTSDDGKRSANVEFHIIINTKTLMLEIIALDGKGE